MLREKHVFIILTALLLLGGCRPGNSNLGKQIDSLLRRTFQSEEPGGSVIVVRKGETILRGAYGMADLELGIPVSPDHVFAIGSMTKQFTAVAILMLMEQGRLSLEDDIRTYIPDYPTHGQTLTIEHLLTHTSGIIDLFDIPEWFEDLRKDVTPAELTDYFKDKSLLFDPGTQHQYSNAGYVLLGRIIEEVSGQTYARFLKEHIFDPLGMNHTIVGDQEAIIPRRVPGYIISHVGIENAGYFSISHQFGGGSIWSCIDDLAKWNKSLLENQLISVETLESAFSAYILNDGQETHYGYGWQIGNFYDRTLIAHGGSSVGFNAYGMMLMEDELYIAVLTNTWSYDMSQNPYLPDPIAMKIAKLMIGKSIHEEVMVPIELDSITLDKYVGVYRVAEEDYRIISRKGNQLYSQRTGGSRNKIYPLSESEFFYDSPGRFEFVFDEEGIVIEANWRSEEGILHVGRRTDLPLPEPKKPIHMTGDQLEKFVGAYRGMIVFKFNIEKGDNHLIISSKLVPTGIFLPESELSFFMEDQDEVVIHFKEDDNGYIEGFSMMREGKEYNLKKVR